MANTKAQSNIQVRIDSKTKKEAKKTLEEMGLDISSAVKLFLRTVVTTQSIPFQVRTKNGFTPEQERQMIKETEEALRKGKGYKSAEELHAAILAED